MIQMNALLKNRASKQLDYGQDEFKKLMDLSINKYQELMGIAPEELWEIGSPMAQNHKLSAGTFSGIFNHYQEEF